MPMEILVGPIASGKSTYARKAAREGKIIVNDDAIVELLHAGNYTLYQKRLKPLYKTIELAIIQSALLHKQTVVIDRPNFARVTRTRYIGLAKAFDQNVTIILFPWDLPEVNAKRRALSDDRGLSLESWLKAARRHFNLYEPPDQAIERFDTLIHCRPKKGKNDGFYHLSAQR